MPCAYAQRPHLNWKRARIVVKFCFETLAGAIARLA